jgi:hypothetical protein
MPHPSGIRARVLLTSVFGRYAQDEFGSRSINPMELYHNQVTRLQGAFSLRVFHRSWGIETIPSVNVCVSHFCITLARSWARTPKRRRYDVHPSGLRNTIDVRLRKLRFSLKLHSEAEIQVLAPRAVERRFGPGITSLGLANRVPDGICTR